MARFTPSDLLLKWHWDLNINATFPLDSVVHNPPKTYPCAYALYHVI